MEKEFDDIKGIFQEREIFTEDEIKKIKEYRIKSSTDSIVFSKLFLLAYDSFYNNSIKIKGLEECKYIAEGIREDIEKYDGYYVNNYYVEQKIKKFIRDKRDKMNSLINLFLEGFEENFTLDFGGGDETN